MTETTKMRLSALARGERVTIRMNQDEFHELLLEDIFFIDNSLKRRYLQGIPLGEGVYSVRLLPPEWSAEFGTIALKPRTEWITQGTGLVFKPCKCQGGH